MNSIMKRSDIYELLTAVCDILGGGGRLYSVCTGMDRSRETAWKSLSLDRLSGKRGNTCEDAKSRKLYAPLY